MCSQGCLHGRCILPEVCVCDFGWTSSNCSVKCQCNEHGQCANETFLDVCHDCRNHTVVSVFHVSLVLAVGCVTYASRWLLCGDPVTARAGIRFSIPMCGIRCQTMIVRLIWLVTQRFTPQNLLSNGSRRHCHALLSNTYFAKWKSLFV